MANKKELTLDDVKNFWELFTAKHPLICDQFSGKVFMDNAIVAFQPHVMTDESYEIYNRFLKRWYADNGFMEREPNFVVVALTNEIDKTVRAIDTDKIVSIEGIDGTFSAVTIKEDDIETPVTIVVKEFVEDLRKRVYIF